MFDGVGRRQDQTTGQLVNIGQHSLNGYERNCLFRNVGDGSFVEVAAVHAADRVEDGRGLSLFDYDQDGHVDILLRNYAQPAQLLRNAGGDGHWMEIKLVGTRSNRDAVGARITIEVDGRSQSREVHLGSGYLSSSSLVQHFGLGAATRIDSVHIRWPSGLETRLRNLAADQQWMLIEGENRARRVWSWRVPADAISSNGISLD
jgi:hypothetical protein